MIGPADVGLGVLPWQAWPWPSGADPRREEETRVPRWFGLEQVPGDWGRSVVTIGVFDGVHVGHQAIVRRAIAVARERQARSVVVTFDPHPMAVVRPDAAPPMLSTLPHRIELLEALDPDAVLVLPFTGEFAHESPEEFVQRVLVAALHAVAVVVGTNFRFGHRAAGDVATLERLGAEEGFTAEGVPLVCVDDIVASSSAARELVLAGDTGTAARLLGRPHRVEGVVIRGDQRGRALGYPTANLASPPETAVPADGVYAGRLLRADGTSYPAAVSIGTNPTFDGRERRVEAYALDHDDLELYGEHLGLDVADRLRPTLRFDSVEALKEQMADDVRQVRARMG